MIQLKNKEDIYKMRKGGAIISSILESLSPLLKPGLSTLEINDYCEAKMREAGGIPSCLDYEGYPKAICTSINEVVCHGIPSKDVLLKEGDLINIDLTIYYEGFHVDMSKSFAIGEVSPLRKKLLTTTQTALEKAIAICKPKTSFGRIGEVIEQHVKKEGFSIVEDYCGHGIGKSFHEDPQILHFKTSYQQPFMQEGMTFTIEPMINAGTKYVYVLEDHWTVVTQDGKDSCQFEHTIAITSSGYEILTLA